VNQNVLLHAEDLSRYYDHHCAVNNLNIELKKGEVLGLLGPNGAGKSTTMQMLTGNLAPTEGLITVNGIDLLEQPKLAKQHIGYLPEQPPVYRDMQVNEYLDYCARLHHLPTSQRGSAIDSAKQRCGLTDVGKRLIGHLSKGYQQRVGIAQAILHNPAVVILDEPTVGLDPIQIQEIRHLIRELGDSHSVILSTHILPEVQAVCDRVQIIHQGNTVFSDTLEGLEHRHAEPVLSIHFANAVDEHAFDVVRSIDGVEQVMQISDEHYVVTHADDQNIVPAVCQFATEQGWEISALIPQAVTLEQIFMNLIHNDQKQEKAA
jgi:ABC-2 type transport system ATP-binding protein